MSSKFTTFYIFFLNIFSSMQYNNSKQLVAELFGGNAECIPARNDVWDPSIRELLFLIDYINYRTW